MPTRGDRVRAYLNARDFPDKESSSPPTPASSDVVVAKVVPATPTVPSGPAAGDAMKATAARSAPYAPGEGRKAATQVIQAAVDKLRKDHPGKYSEPQAWAWVLDNDPHCQAMYAAGEVAEAQARRPKG